jgi:hypothetical protein
LLARKISRHDCAVGKVAKEGFEQATRDWHFSPTGDMLIAIVL